MRRSSSVSVMTSTTTSTFMPPNCAFKPDFSLRRRVLSSSGTSPRPRPTSRSPPPIITLTPHTDDMPTLPATLPPTPSPSVHSPSRQSSLEPVMLEKHQSAAGPSHGWHSQAYAQHPPLPPTPPAFETDQAGPSTVNFVEPILPSRRVKAARRPLSAYPQGTEESIFPPHRKYTDPTPHTRFPSSEDEVDTERTRDNHELDVDLDAYSATDYETEDNAGDREPTLSFVTASTADSTTSTPPSLNYGYPTHMLDVKGDIEPKIRMRGTMGRASLSNTYSSAESSIGSGAFSYHAYGDQIYHSPPPLPQMPGAFNPSVGLGLSTDYPTPADQPSRLPLSASHSFSHRPWKSDMVSRLRSDSGSSAFTVASTSTDISAGSSSQIPLSDAVFPYTYDNFTLPYEQELAEPEALAMIKEGREKMLNMEKIDSLGGISAMNDDVIRSLSGVTHLLLPSCGPRILNFLPRLLSVLAPSLVVLDLSKNNLCIMPDSLQYCTSLEELNLSDNPLQALPNWFSRLVALRVLVVDSCGLSALPQELCHLRSLHTICVRRNNLMGLPSWLCLLPLLETLKVDENPFTPEWARIVPVILAGRPEPIAPGPSKRHSHHRHLSINNGLRIPVSDMSLGNPQPPVTFHQSPTSSTSPGTNEQSFPSAPPSAAQSAYHLPLNSIAEDCPHSAPPPTREDERLDGSVPGSLRKMRSAGALLRSINHSPGRSNEQAVLSPPPSERFATLGGGESRRATSAMGNYPKETFTPKPSALSSGSGGTPMKQGKWGFLRKMSMKSLRPEKDKASSMAASAASNLKTLPPLPPMRHQHSDPIQPFKVRPTMLSSVSAATVPSRRIADFEASEFGQFSSPLPAASTMPLSGLPFVSPINSVKTGVRGKRRSFLPLDGPPSLNVYIPSHAISTSDSVENIPSLTMEAPTPMSAVPPVTQPLVESPVDSDVDQKYAKGLEAIKLILRDLHDLSRRSVIPQDGFAIVGNHSADSSYALSNTPSDYPGSPRSSHRDSFDDVRRARRPTLELDSVESGPGHVDLNEEPFLMGKKFKNDKSKRGKIIKEIWETERTYVRNLGELVTIYVKPASNSAGIHRNPLETVIPAAERKIVFGGVESILAIHRDNFLPALEKVLKKLVESVDDDEGELSTETAYNVGEVFRTYIAYMKQYSTYITNFDNALARMKTWSTSASGTMTLYPGRPSAPSISQAAISAGMSAVSLPTAATQAPSGQQMTSSQRKRVKTFLKKSKEHPMHSQISLESYLLLPIQRVPRYKLLLTELAMCTPARTDGMRDTLDDALNEIASLASLMNEEKRDADSRLRLLNWQKRVINSGRSPLVQPHRRLILEGAMTLSRIVKKTCSFAECEMMPNEDVEQTITHSKIVVPVDYIKSEAVEKEVMLILCSDMMVLATERGEGWEGPVNVFNVLRMGTMQEPATVTSGTVLRVVDNNSIYYFKGLNRENTLQWCRAINTARR